MKLITIIGAVFGIFGLLAGEGMAGSVDHTAIETVPVRAGPFVAGSDQAERELAYQLDEEAYGHSVTRKNGWYDGERMRVKLDMPAYAIMRTPVTNQAYARFVSETGRAPPLITEDAWKRQGLIHPYDRARRHMWRKGTPPPGRERHPVVLVTWDDARAYAEWLSRKTGETWRLPTELEWEKAARGTDGRIFPWGNTWDPSRLNSHDDGPFDTVEVGSFPEGGSPFGMLDAAGQVFEWTGTPSGKDRYLVKGGSWDDKGCGVCRPAARHSRPRSIRHILVGFRLIRVE